MDRPDEPTRRPGNNTLTVVVVLLSFGTFAALGLCFFSVALAFVLTSATPAPVAVAIPVPVSEDTVLDAADVAVRPSPPAAVAETVTPPLPPAPLRPPAPEAVPPVRLPAAPKVAARPKLPSEPYDPAIDEEDFAGILSEDYPEPKTLARTRSNYVKFISTKGDFIGQGKRESYDLTKVGSVQGRAAGPLSVSFSGWGVEFAPPLRAKQFGTGTYLGATRLPFRSGAEPGLNFSGNARGNNTLSGSFAVWELEVEDGKVVAFAADFLQRGEKTGPPLYGRVRYNSKFE